MRWSLSIPFVVLACGAGSRAPGPSVVDVGATPDAGAVVVDDARARPTARRTKEEEARELFALGRKAYADGDYAGALRLFTDAQHAAARPEVLYDIGSCLEKMGRREEAAAIYEDYVRSGNLSHIDRMSMELRIEQLRAAP
jgi:tetratricopeptide (TPR) repeat protein